MQRHPLTWSLVVCAALLVGNCGGDQQDPLAARLVRASDLPGEWEPFEAPESQAVGFCGRTASGPEPKRSKAVAFAVDHDDGPIFGERIEMYDGDDVGEAPRQWAELRLPCEWSESGSRWRMTREDPPSHGDDGRVFLIVSLDRPDSFNYQVAMRPGSDLIFFVVNQRTADRALVDSLAEIVWSRAHSSE